MPTPEQIQELIDNTTTAWTTSDGVSGMMFTSNNDTQKSIFIPAAGDAWGGSLVSGGDYGYVWSSMLSTGNVFLGQNLYFNSDNAFLSSLNRNNGFAVRGVIGEIK